MTTDENEIPEDQDQNDDVDASRQEADEDELSLDQLSQAYAQVLKEREDVGDDGDAKKANSQPNADTASDKPANTKIKRPKRVQKTLTEIDSQDNAGCPISPESIVESILFVGGPKDVSLTSRKIAALLRDVSPKEVTAIVKKLNKTYEDENAPYRIDSNKGSFRMRLADSMAHIQDRFRGGTREAKLSQQAIDVIAVVAYNQPVTRAQVDKIRARPSGPILTQLVRRQLLDVERTETKPIVRHYRTTDRFLDLFGLDEIEDLPQSHDVADIEELAD